MTTNPELAHFLSHLTSDPGVYRMLDAEQTVLYVGKAVNLKKRVQSYFNTNNKTPKTRALVEQIHSIEVIITRSETEALLLESNLIKSLRPKYNVLMRDDKTYPYIYVSSHSFPRIERIRCKKRPEKGRFYGPYPNTYAVQSTLIFIQKLFKIRNCSDTFYNARTRPCLQYQIKRCSAPCTNYISVEEYQQSITHAINFLSGDSKQILDALGKQMDRAVDELNFEKAAEIRDQIRSLRAIQEQQGVAQTSGELDIIVLEARPGFACVQCVTVRDGDVLASQSFFPQVPEHLLDSEDNELENTLWQEVFKTFVTFYYIDNPERIPPLLLTNNPLTDSKPLESLLTERRGQRCRIQSLSRGDKARWVDFALNNLQLSIREHITSARVMNERFDALVKLMSLNQRPKRLECFDISHTQGDNTVASCVVFNSAGPSPRDYRRFNITGITPGDDYAAMEQAITRRFKRLMQMMDLPDVLIIDGGKGQLSVAKRVLSSLNITQVALVGIAKGADRKVGFERLIINDADEITLAPDSPALLLLQHIRDEAHRFAITAHRKKRQKTSLESSLETIEGVGPKRRQALLRRFGGQRELAKAPLEEIAKVPGIGSELAIKIYDSLRRI